jgi:hypothetical protein
MLIPFGVLSAAGAGVGVAGDYELIESAFITGSTTGQVDFSVSSFSATYKHLQLRVVGGGNAGGSQGLNLRFNSDTGSNYAFHFLSGNGSAVSSSAFTSQTLIQAGLIGGNDLFGSAVVDILDPFSTSKNKTTRSLSGYQPSPLVRLYSGLFMSTSAVTSLNITSSATYFLAGTRVSLYGIRG